MVDYIYYGRGDRANIRLGDGQVRAIIESHQRGRLDVVAELRRMADDDLIPGDERGLGHLYILAQPEIAAEEILVELLGRADIMAVMQETIPEFTAYPRTSSRFGLSLRLSGRNASEDVPPSDYR